MISASFAKFEFDGDQVLSASFIGIQTLVLPKMGVSAEGNFVALSSKPVRFLAQTKMSMDEYCCVFSSQI